jgi:hypothetical protein
MKYLCLVYLDAEHWNACPDPECGAYAEKLAGGALADTRAAPTRLAAAPPLHPVHTATTVRVRGGEVQLYDGPFAETKELLAGFYLIEARDLNEAIRIAAGIPPARHGSIEVRPVRELDLTAAAS